jgi:hypothetical protein
LYPVQERSVTRLAHGKVNTVTRLAHGKVNTFMRIGLCFKHEFPGPTVDFFSKFRRFHRMIEKTIDIWMRSTSEHYSRFIWDHPALGCFHWNYL